MVGLQATFCLLACVVAVFVTELTEGTLSEVDLAHHTSCAIATSLDSRPSPRAPSPARGEGLESRLYSYRRMYEWANGPLSGGNSM